MGVGPRFLLTLALVLAALGGISLFGYQYWEVVEQVPLTFNLASAETKPELCIDTNTREQIRSVMFDALDEALKVHIKHLYEVWLKDDRGQPERARTGAENGVRAYLQARKGATEWSPPPCAG